MVVYIDAIWLLNFGFDSLLLLWTGLILKQKTSWWRIVLGGLIGSATVIIYVTPYSYLLDIIAVKIGISVLMIVIKCGFVNWRVLLKTLITFYVVTFVAGGMLYGLHSLFSSHVSSTINSAHSSVNLYGDRASWIFVVAAFPLTYLFLKSFSSTIKVAQFFQQQQIKATCLIDGFQLELDGLIDTGNQLSDPVSKAPIVIISLKEFKKTLPDELIAILKMGIGMSADLPELWKNRMRVIPYKVVGNDHSLLVAFKPDSFEINHQQKRCLVSFTEQQLSSQSNYNAIIHPDLM